MTKCYDVTPDVTPAPWFNNHENLFTLAEWIRKEHGWHYWERNALDIIEKPWKWEQEWKYASGAEEYTGEEG